MSFYFSLLPFVVPLLAGFAALFVGLRKTLWVVLGIAAAMLGGPFVYFGIWGLIEGVALSDVMTSVSVITRPMVVIAGYMVFWSALYGGIAALVVWGWQRWRPA